MDASKCKVLTDLCDSLTTSGESKLDERKLKELKKICRLSEEYVVQCFELLWSQLRRNHAEIRLSTFQIIDELFRRSHRFRELLLENFQAYLELTLEIDSNSPLPPPRKAAEELKNLAYQALRSWHGAYSSGYRKLELAFNYLRSCHQVDFDRADHMSAVQRQREEEAKQKAEAQSKKVVDRVLAEIEENEEDMRSLTSQLTTCFKLLLPSQTSFDVFDSQIFSQKTADSEAPSKESNSGLVADTSQQVMKQHGLLNRKSNIQVSIASHSTVRESAENTDIIANLDELKVLLTIKYIPMVVKSMAIMQKYALEQETLAKLLDLKGMMQGAVKDLDLLNIQRLKDSDDDEDDDLIEIPEEIDEVSFFKSRLGMTGKTTSDEPSTSKAKRKAPVVAYDLDLEYWESPGELTIPEVLPNDASRGWVPKSDSTQSFHSSLQELYSSRKIEFSGKFVPVKWTCRAPLPSGRLCPRMDRLKCPMHGPIIARNGDGSPANGADVTKFAQIKNKQREENPDWQDPSLLRDIQAETGVDLKVKEKCRKSKSRNSKLTNIEKMKNTTRSRLESKVLSRRAMKRVASAMNHLDQKKLKDKFCHSFNSTFAK
ncbi:UV-stimulated scaffold protein A-like [Watersipora subatra]|uniref:UV-stimulated scaffold protein A-like n=1 Tax=Watersipora subatra TaxID=2589382 RepID=UPI00355C2902